MRMGIILLSLVTAILASYIFYVINSSSQKQVEILKAMVKQEAIAHFDNILVTRRWNAEHGGVFVKQRPGMKPNPYLKEDSFIRSENQEIYIKINPAWMTRQISEIANKTSHYQYHIVSLNPLNPGNKTADQFEQRALEFFEQYPEELYYFEFDDRESLKINFMGMLKTEESCMPCHKEQGYKVGDVRGGIRVSIPAANYNLQLDTIQTRKTLFIAVLSLILVLVFIAFYYFLKTIHAVMAKDRLITHQARLAQMGEMLNSIAHHWRQPLTALGLKIQDLLDAYDYGELNREYLEKNVSESIKAIGKMSNTINSFRQFTTVKSQAEHFSIPEVVDEALELVIPSLNDHLIHISQDFADDVYAFGDRQLLSQSITNLLINAQDALVERNVSNKTIHLQVKKDEKYAFVMVSDNGRGIEKAVMERIFEPFFTTKDPALKTGTGLYFAKIFIEQQLQGKLSAKNTGQGACFTIRLPICLAAPKQ